MCLCIQHPYEGAERYIIYRQKDLSSLVAYIRTNQSGGALLKNDSTLIG